MQIAIKGEILIRVYKIREIHKTIIKINNNPLI